jgi:hypothetical protein
MPDEEIARSVGKRYSEEENAAFDFCTAISGHGEIRLSGLRLN